MTNYKFGEVVLVPFPFTDQTGTKKRPAVIVSSSAYNLARLDLVLMAITSQIGKIVQNDETEILEWREAGLLKPSIVKPVFTTIEKNLVLKRLGILEDNDKENLKKLLEQF